MRAVSTMFMVVIFAFLFKGTSAQLQSTLCPNNFRYEHSGNNYIGVVTLWNITSKHGHTTVKIEMEQPEISKLDYKGKISLLNIDEKSEGQPITYRVDFPLQNAVPRVTGITVNNVRICGFQKDSSSRATFYLTHTIDSIEPRAGRKVRSTASGNCNCGRDNSESNTNFVINGQHIGESQFPWIVAIFVWRRNWVYHCGGTLVSAKTVISAAHCFYSRQSQLVAASKVLLVLGRNSLRQWQSGRNEYIDRIIIHPDYPQTHYDADIAILHLKNRVTFTTSIRPICLWQGSSEIIEGSTGTVIGWGQDEYNSHSDLPKLVEMTFVSCRRTIYRGSWSNRALCAGRDGSTPCFGDSGSGVIVHDGQKWILRGVMNRASMVNNGQCDVHRHSMFADAAKYTSWINSNILR